MIRLDVKEYCNGCEHFEPEYVGRNEYEDGMGGIVVVDGKVRCIHCDKCFAIEQYIHRKMHGK